MVLSCYKRLSQSPVAIFELWLSECVRNLIAEFRITDPDAD